MSLAVEATELTMKFGQIGALDGISLNIKAGEIYCLIGPNGAGKTTTLRIICTLVKPTTGTIRIFDQDATKQPGSKYIARLPMHWTLFGHLE